MKTLYIRFLSAVSVAFFFISASIVNSDEKNVVAPAPENVILTTKSEPTVPQALYISNPGLPLRLDIPRIGVSAKVHSMGRTYDGNMAVPDNFTDVSWFNEGPRPGEKGNAVMGGHVDNGIELKGVFYRLYNLRVGDDIHVRTDNNITLHFKVVEIALYDYKDSNVEKIFGSAESAHLNLITCVGRWLPEEKTYDKRLVIFTELVS